MSIRSDVLVLTAFELCKVVVLQIVMKNSITIDTFVRKKVVGVALEDADRCHTCGTHNVSASTQAVAGTTPHTVRAVQQRLHKRGRWVRAERLARNEKEFLDRFIQVPESTCRPFRWSKDETQ